MARKKVSLAYIENDSSRRDTYKKRVKGIIKKTEELSVLCGVDACAIIYGQHDQTPIVWPKSERETLRIISAFQIKSEVDQAEKQLDQQAFLNQSVIKSKEKLKKIQRKNREIQMENLVSEIMSGRLSLNQVAPCDFEDFIWVIEDKLRTINHRIGKMGEVNNSPSISVGDNAGVNPN